MRQPDPDLLSGIAVVTGASTGLGRALSVALARRGMRVAGIARNGAGLAETAALAGATFEPLRADIADPDQIRGAWDQARARGPVTVLVNNAAVYPRRDFLDETAQSFMATVATNLGGPVAASRLALDDMVAQGFGRIVNVSTFADIAPLPASSAYAVSKGAQRILTRALVADLADRFPRIVINDWMPGMLATRMGIVGGLAPESAAEWGAELALWLDPTLTGTVFEMGREVPPPRSLRRRIKDRVLLRRRTLRVLGG